MIDGLQIVKHPFLAGVKKAVQFGNGPIHVSPAMWDLLSTANEAEMEQLVKSIEVLRLPEPDNLRSMSIAISPISWMVARTMNTSFE